MPKSFFNIEPFVIDTEQRRKPGSPADSYQMETRFTIEFFGIQVFVSDWAEELDIYYVKDDLLQVAQEQLSKYLTEALDIGSRVEISSWGTVTTRS